MDIPELIKALDAEIAQQEAELQRPRKIRKREMYGWQIENCVLYIVTAVTIVGAYYFGAGGDSWWGLVFLLFTNSSKSAKP